MISGRVLSIAPADENTRRHPPLKKTNPSLFMQFIADAITELRSLAAAMLAGGRSAKPSVL